jgi:hypothetical protein
LRSTLLWAAVMINPSFLASRTVARAPDAVCISCQTQGMAFKVNPTDSRPPLEFGDGDKLEVLPSGVLKIRRADKTTLYINPSMWENVEQTPTAAEAAGT